MPKNIVLTGMMGAGKTTVGRLLKMSLRKDFVDIDTEIEKEAGKTIVEIFECYGEELFRKLEHKIILNFSRESDIIISIGGGALENEENYINLSSNGVLFYLQASAEELYERVKHDKNRPLLKTLKPKDTLEKLLKKREERYLLSDEVIETSGKSAANIVEEIKVRYEKY
ncbi:MAG: shikimate kinase [Candidatus Gastranaerophilales bacterium]|nr:shikimate kinase [Candidatus Gastranaerophilales bacterium]